MATASAASAGAARSGQEQPAERLGRRDLLVLRLELQRRKRGSSAGSAGQRASRSTR
jgi:hypothetical protein